MPHNIYLHSALVLSRRQYMATTARKKEAVKYFGIESALSLAVRMQGRGEGQGDCRVYFWARDHSG